MQLTWLTGAPSRAASVHRRAVGQVGLGSPATQLMRAVSQPLVVGGLSVASCDATRAIMDRDSHWMLKMGSVFELADATDVYTFWLGDGPTGTPKSVWKAVVDRENLTQFTTPKLVIPMRDIRSLHSGGYGPINTRYYASGVTLTTEAGSFELWPVNPMKPHPSGGENGDEMRAFFEVVTALWQHRKPHYVKDPYVRQHIASHKKMQQDFDGSVSPIVYFHQGMLWSRPARVKIPVAIITIAISIVAVMGLVGIGNWLFGR